jgi:hypothetical protein
MTSDQLHLERRAAQRFEFHTAVSIRLLGNGAESCGFTQDLSGRGALLNTEAELRQGDALELTLLMPSEITLGENMRVRSKARVVRVCGAGAKGGIAVQLEGAYEFLPEEEKRVAVSARSSALEQRDDAGMSANVFHLRGITS